MAAQAARIILYDRSKSNIYFRIGRHLKETSITDLKKKIVLNEIIVTISRKIKGLSKDQAPILIGL